MPLATTNFYFCMFILSATVVHIVAKTGFEIPFLEFKTIHDLVYIVNQGEGHRTRLPILALYDPRQVT